MKEFKIDEQDIRKILQPDTPARQLRRRIRRGLFGAVYAGLLFAVFFYALNFGAFWQRLKYDVSAKNPTPPVTTEPTPVPEPEPVPVPEIPDYTPQIEIPKIGVVAPLVLNVSSDQILNQLKNGVTHFDLTAMPGQVGNTVIVGHSSDFPWSDGKYKNIFALLDKLEPGDLITIPYQKQKLVYRVSSKKIVAPSDVSILRKTDFARLTLLTCYPVGTTRSRLIIIADLAEGNPTGVQQTEPPIDLSSVRPR